MSEQHAADESLEGLLRHGDRALQSLITEYEPLEAFYRDAITLYAQVREVTNTSAVPKSLTPTAISAR